MKQHEGIIREGEKKHLSRILSDFLFGIVSEKRYIDQIKISQFWKLRGTCIQMSQKARCKKEILNNKFLGYFHGVKNKKIMRGEGRTF